MARLIGTLECRDQWFLKLMIDDFHALRVMKAKIWNQLNLPMWREIIRKISLWSWAINGDNTRRWSEGAAINC